MKNIYRVSCKLNLALDSFVIIPTDDSNELFIYSHYVPDGIMNLRSGKYVFDRPKQGEEKKEGKRGKIFMPDIKNCFSNILIKEQGNSSITIECDMYLTSKGDTVDVAFCEEWEQQYLTVSPITAGSRKQSVISGDRKYFANFKQGGDTEVFKPFRF